mgnify:CR=1 FL=1
MFVCLLGCRVECPHCGRRFAELVAERHIPKCADIIAKPSRLKAAGAWCQYSSVCCSGCVMVRHRRTLQQIYATDAVITEAYACCWTLVTDNPCCFFLQVGGRPT